MTLRALALLTFVLVTYNFTANAATADTIKVNQQVENPDSALLKKRIINHNFGSIYEENLRLSFGGNEYFNKVKTQLTADLAPNFILFSSPNSRFMFVFTPRVKIRLLSSEGAPVKSPSYMPGASVFFRVNEDTFNPKFFSFGYSHHSNGARGPSENPDGTFNTLDGKFTTNFYTLTYFTGKRVDKKDVITDRYDNLGLEVHAGLFNLGLSEGLKDHYGFIRINGGRVYNFIKAYNDPLEAGHKTYANWQRIQFDFTYIADKYDNYSAIDIKKRLNVSLKYYYSFPFMQGSALVIGGGYRGQDDYNQSFQDSYGYVTIGLAAGLSFGYHKH
ncbi:hypothetical protein [Mucilaginibacter flavus]|uniref:hypothetical protein n=1 Tax=Mucilaginibacter flavus TaxID=931504 RepID=UPI0025B4DAE7|nr:hypothetical protein [Mucilaginibacter flavus]MDN3582245.1 hypothetical protein [Mucilaginibacter flavus]